jgi:hypothetical protein
MTITDAPLVDYSPAAAAAAADWVVEVRMPGVRVGRNPGSSVGWLCSNDDHPAGRNARWYYARRLQIANAWRHATIQALTDAGVPTGLTCPVEVRVGFRFHTARSNRRDLPNLEPTLKSIIDALNPTKRQVQKGKLITIHGRGVIADDHQKYLLRGPEVLIGEPLGIDSHCGGMVILYLRRLTQPAQGAERA